MTRRRLLRKRETENVDSAVVFPSDNGHQEALDEGEAELVVPLEVDRAQGSEAEATAGGPRSKSDRRLGEILIERRLVTRSQLSEAELQQDASGKTLATLLVELGTVDELDLAKILSEELGLPLADLRHAAPEDSTIAALPESLARTHVVIPVRVGEDVLEVAMADPLDEEALSTIVEKVGKSVLPQVAPPSDIRRAIERSYRATTAVDRHVQAFLATEALTAKAITEQGEAGAQSAPVVQVVNLVLTQAVRDRASDVHIEPQDSHVRIRFRIDGALHDVLALPANIGPAVVSRVKVLADMNIVERRRPQDGQIEIEVDGRPLDIRVATTATIWGEKAVLRLLDKSRSLYRLDELGMDERTHELFSRQIRSPFGMVICAGPTGSGKTTTLYAALAEINRSELNIMTVEDPVEYILPSINQIQIQDHAGVSFATGLKSILRQDPDVILVGEMRDAETARIGIQSALTGHLVLTSLHATDAATALQRFLDMGIEPFLVASSVLGVVGQRLVRRICRFCKVNYDPTPEELRFYKDAGGPPKFQFWHGEGCNFCFRTGYEDRIGIYELLRNTDEMRALIMRRAPHDEIRALATSQGMLTLLDGGIRFVEQDITTISEVIRSVFAG
jgi:type IV pilus assembly protein PilB